MGAVGLDYLRIRRCPFNANANIDGRAQGIPVHARTNNPTRGEGIYASTGNNCPTEMRVGASDSIRAVPPRKYPESQSGLFPGRHTELPFFRAISIASGTAGIETRSTEVSHRDYFWRAR